MPGQDGEYFRTQLPALRAAGAPSSKPDRVKVVREDAHTRNSAQVLAGEEERLQIHREDRYRVRWGLVRTFYATLTERVEASKRTIWLRLLAAQMHRSLVAPSASSAQLESILVAAVKPLANPASTWKDIIRSFRVTIPAFQRGMDDTVDYRELLCSCLVLDRWQDGELRLLSLWLNEYSLPSTTNRATTIRASDLRRLLCTPCAGNEDERSMGVYVEQITCSISRKDIICVDDMMAFAKKTASLQSLIKDLCWRRLIDDMRLQFYRAIYEHAMQRVEREEQHCRLVAAMQLWRLREPRARFARWKEHVVLQKLRHRCEGHYLKSCRAKLVRRLRDYHALKLQMKHWLAAARRFHAESLVRWVFHAWHIHRMSTLELHRASWRRGTLHFESRVISRTWRAFTRLWEAARSHRAKRQSRIERFIERRQAKMMMAAWSEWIFVYRRHKEIKAAMLQEHQLHTSMHKLRREEEELRLMRIEDAISMAIEAQERERLEQERRRALQEATEKVYATRKIRQQEENRIQHKARREALAVAEIKDAWARISERVAAEVRVSTIAWFTSVEGTRVIQAEAAEMFERDPVMLQRALLQDPAAYAVPGCRWQLRLEDYGGRSAKAVYLNVETLEKFMCDELVMENCEEITREVLIQRKIDEARSRVQAKAGEVVHERDRHAAATKIQMLFLCRHALLIARSKIQSILIKRVEPMTGDVVYFNIAKQETRRRPHRLLGSDERYLPIESTSWVRRIDDNGNNYYQHLETGETSWTPPPYHFMCVTCTHNFATRRWNETGSRYCIVCYAEGLHKDLFKPVATWTKLSVQPAKCLVCRNGPAEVVCHQCQGDAACLKCCHAVHRNPRLANHSEMDYLMST